jgi:hypothetical protein
MEKEMKTLKDKVASSADVPSKKLQEAKDQNRGELTLDQKFPKEPF